MRPRVLAAVLGVALLGYVGLAWLSRGEPAAAVEEAQAARTMEQAIRALADEAARRGFPPDPATDPNRTGLIGLPFSPITTTLGSLPAKRTGAQPAAAALMARLLRQAGVRTGDRVAVDSSGSFPGFAIATLLAARSLGAEPVVLVSVGASTYGANRPDFALPDMLHVLVQRGFLRREPLGVSPGGASDLGKDMDPAALEAVLARARSRGIPVLREPDLAQDVAERERLLGDFRVLVSVGGNWPAAGPGVLGGTGLLRPEEAHPAGPGLIQSTLRRGRPVIRLLDVQDLCARTGLPFDPIPWQPLPKPPRIPRLLAAVGLLLALAAGLIVRRWGAESRG